MQSLAGRQRKYLNLAESDKKLTSPSLDIAHQRQCKYLYKLKGRSSTSTIGPNLCNRH
uniref:Uncharacterized protein n=1 Tax=Oryza brachyantha TaxID=4533 RepID=J3MG80_ORYBR